MSSMINPNIPASRIKEISEKMEHFRSMSADDYTRELTDLIEEAGIHLPDADSSKVLGDAFLLIKTRLGVKIESKFVIPAPEGE